MKDVTRTLTEEEWAIVLECLATEEEASRGSAADWPEQEETLLAQANGVQALMDKIRK